MVAEREEIRKYQIVGRMSHDDGVLWDTRLADALNHLGFARNDSQGMFEVLRRGLAAVEIEMTSDDPAQVMTRRIGQEYEATRRRVAEDKRLEAILAGRGIEGFIEWCQENGIDYDAFLMRNRLTAIANTEAPYSEKAKAWLTQVLHSGAPFTTEEVRELARLDHFLSDNEAEARKQWDIIRHVARINEWSRPELPRGTWQR